MATVYGKCDASVAQIVDEMIEAHFPDLKEAEVKVQCMFADAGADAEGDPVPAVKLHGLPCEAVVKINATKDRAEGKADATITIDKRVWDDKDDRQKQALMHHELYHLIVKRDDVGQIETDDLGRPKLKMRQHDWEIAGFLSTVKLFGEAATEVKAAKAFRDQYGQFLFDFVPEAAVAKDFTVSDEEVLDVKTESGSKRRRK